MLGVVRVLSGVAIFASKYECSSFCSSADMSLLKKIENFNLSSSKFEVPNPVVGCCEYSQKLQILGPNATALLL